MTRSPCPVDALAQPPDADKDQVDYTQEKDSAPEPNDATDDGYSLAVRRPE